MSKEKAEPDEQKSLPGMEDNERVRAAIIVLWHELERVKIAKSKKDEAGFTLQRIMEEEGVEVCRYKDLVVKKVNL